MACSSIGANIRFVCGVVSTTNNSTPFQGPEYHMHVVLQNAAAAAYADDAHTLEDLDHAIESSRASSFWGLRQELEEAGFWVYDDLWAGVGAAVVEYVLVIDRLLPLPFGGEMFGDGLRFISTMKHGEKEMRYLRDVLNKRLEDRDRRQLYGIRRTASFSV